MRWRALAIVVLAPACLFPTLGDLGGEGDASGSDATFEAAADVAPETAPPADGGADADAFACPSGPGPTMVPLPYGFCIDSTEVTESHYQAFVDAITQGYTPTLPSRCDFNGAFALPPDSFCHNGPDAPVACVNWCQAWGYCAWAGKHLCGAPDGGPVDFDAGTDPHESAWVMACSSNGATTYAYGVTVEPYCNTSTTGSFDDDASVEPADANPQCEGPPGVFNLLGNASEWLDSCRENDAGAHDDCLHLGGGSADTPFTCTQLDWDERAFSGLPSVHYAQGFRCCSP